MNDDSVDSESDSVMGASTSSSEGEHNISPLEDAEYPEFDIKSWSPKGAAGTNYLCLIPFANVYKQDYEGSSHTGKIKVSHSHRQRRMHAFRSGKTTGRNIADEKHLRNAANSNDLSTVIKLLDSGVDPCCYDESKRTALHFAASQGYELVVKALLDSGADPNQQDVLGNTPLHLAACTGHISVVTFLLRAGTDLRSVDRHGRTPFTISKSRLKFLSEVKSYSSQQVKDEALQLCDMMKAYLDLSGVTDGAEELDELCNQLKNVSTREEVDHINFMLADFASLKIEKNDNFVLDSSRPDNTT